jgi:hypothetical protein
MRHSQGLGGTPEANHSARSGPGRSAWGLCDSLKAKALARRWLRLAVPTTLMPVESARGAATVVLCRHRDVEMVVALPARSSPGTRRPRGGHVGVDPPHRVDLSEALDEAADDDGGRYASAAASASTWWRWCLRTLATICSSVRTPSANFMSPAAGAVSSTLSSSCASTASARLRRRSPCRAHSSGG